MKRPARNEELAVLVFGNAGGQARAKVADWLDLGLMNLWLAAADKHGPQEATGILFQLLACDPEQPPMPEWLKELFIKYRTHLENGDEQQHVTPQEVVQLPERRRGRKLTEQDVRDIRAKVAAGQKQDALAVEYEVSGCLISKIVNRQVWADVA